MIPYHGFLSEPGSGAPELARCKTERVDAGRFLHSLPQVITGFDVSWETWVLATGYLLAEERVLVPPPVHVNQAFCGRTLLRSSTLRTSALLRKENTDSSANMSLRWLRLSL